MNFRNGALRLTALLICWARDYRASSNAPFWGARFVPQKPETSDRPPMVMEVAHLSGQKIPEMIQHIAEEHLLVAVGRTRKLPKTHRVTPGFSINADYTRFTCHQTHRRDFDLMYKRLANGGMKIHRGVPPFHPSCFELRDIIRAGEGCELGVRAWLTEWTKMLFKEDFSKETLVP